ncbi:potassium channel subfamily K member 13-like [Lytechinus variegatus]|uniref:potassium channel subfamily K member 13-like n=1 Tax=Lytechinus variegatus TaxID=7654 RepID=UPI001BB1F1E3|nr:potassium channel subfamily K member 13-like [Lytechinus variegatus]
MGNSMCCRRRCQSRNVSSPKKLKRGESVFDQHPWLRKLQSALVTISLLAILFGYAFIGAAVFVVLESNTELEALHRYEEARRDFLGHVTNVTLNFSSIEDPSDIDIDDMKMDLLLLVDQYEDAMEDVLCKHHTSVKTRNATGKPRWNFFGALFFSATVISTIGRKNVYL